MQPLNSPPIAVSVLGIKQLDDHTAVPQYRQYHPPPAARSN